MDCARNAYTSNNRSICRNELQNLEKSILPKLDRDETLNLLVQNEISSGMNKESFCDSLFSIIGNKECSEFCREKAAFIFYNCIQRAFGTTPTNNVSSVVEKEQKQENDPSSTSVVTTVAEELFIQFSKLVHQRLMPPPTSLKIGLTAVSKTSEVEPNEELRLLMWQIAIVLHSKLPLFIIDTTTRPTQPPPEDDDNNNNVLEKPSPANGGLSQHPLQKHYKEIIHASSLFCQTMARGGLKDAYAEINRHCCNLIHDMAVKIPLAISMHALALLQPLTGISLRDSMNHDGLNPPSILTTPMLVPPNKCCLVHHRHAKTRCSALDACGKIIVCCGDDTRTQLLETMVLPSWENFALLDRSESVRLALINAIRIVVESNRRQNTNGSPVSIVEPAKCNAMFITLLLLMISDGSEKVSIGAKESLERLARPEQDSEPADISALVLLHSSYILDLLLRDSTNKWAKERRVRALQTMSVVVEIIHLHAKSVTKSNNKFPNGCQLFWMIESICTCIGDEDDDVDNAATSCGVAFGSNTEMAQSVLDLVIQNLPFDRHKESSSLGKDGSSTIAPTNNMKSLLLNDPRHASSGITLLAAVIRGMQASSANETSNTDQRISEAKVYDITSALVSRSILDFVSHHHDVALAVFDVSQSLVDYIWPGLERNLTHKSTKMLLQHGKKLAECCDHTSTPVSTVCLHILLCSIQLLSCPTKFDVSIPTRDLLNDLAEKNNKLGTMELFRSYFRPMVHFLVNDDGKIDLWRQDNSRLLAFDALLRNCGGIVVSENFDLVAPVFEKHLCESLNNNIKKNKSESLSQTKESCDPLAKFSVRLTFMSLLETVLADSTTQMDLLHPFTTKLLTTTIVPNLVWHVGAIAGSLRKVSAGALFSLVRSGGATMSSLMQAAPQLFPVLKTNLRDDEATTRELVCAAFKEILLQLPNCLNEEYSLQLYPECIACLDDGSEVVRFMACSTIPPLFRSAREPCCYFKGTPIEFMVQRLFVHMDDPDRRFQRAIFDVLVVAIDIDANVVEKECKKSRLSHRSGEFCDQLLALIK